MEGEAIYIIVAICYIVLLTLMAKRPRLSTTEREVCGSYPGGAGSDIIGTLRKAHYIIFQSPPKCHLSWEVKLQQT